MSEGSSSESSSSEAGWRRWRAVIARVALAIFGLVVVGVLIDRIGVDEVGAAFARTAPILPFAFTLEAARIGCDAWSTRLLLGARGASIPLSTLYAGHVVGHGVMNVFPAGRSASEAVKAGLFHRYLGAAEAVAMGASNQANTLLSSALFSLVCAGAALLVATSTTLAWAIALHFVIVFSSGVGMRVASTNRHVEAFFAVRMPRVGAHLSRFAERSRETPIVAWGPVGAMMAGRVVQTVEYGLLAHAVGIDTGPLESLAVQGLNFVAAAVGVLMPGQLGSSEAVFALAGEALGTDAASAMTIALAAHSVALVWAAIGLGLLLAWRARAPAASPPKP